MSVHAASIVPAYKRERHMARLEAIHPAYIYEAEAVTSARLMKLCVHVLIRTDCKYIEFNILLETH